MPLSGVTGLFGNQIFLFPAADLAVVVSEHLHEDAARLTGAEAQSAARDHARVISGCFDRSTVLPFRFGTTFEDDDAMRRSVRSNQRHFLANVERLRGKAEMHLKVLVDDICPESRNGVNHHHAGQEYLSHLRESASRQRERQSRARALSVQMHRMFLPLAEEITCRRMDSGKMLLDIAHLVDKKTVERYQNKYSSATLADEGLLHAALRSLAAVSLRPSRAVSSRSRIRTFQLHRRKGLGTCRGLSLVPVTAFGSETPVVFPAVATAAAL